MKIARNRYITAPEERDIPESPFQNALTAADEAGKILSGKLTEKELSRLVRYSYYKSDLAKTRNFFNSLDPDILRSIFTKLPDEGARGRVVNCIQDYTFQDFISKNPNQFQRLVNIFIGVASLPKINSIRDNFSVFWFASLGYQLRNSRAPEEYLDFLEGYSRVLSSFSDCESYKAERCLKSSFEHGYYKLLFLFLELTEAPGDAGVIGDNKQAELFREITEEDIRFIADISPKTFRYATNILEKFVESRQAMGGQHANNWQRIGEAFRGNPAADALAWHFFTVWYYKTSTEAIEFMCEFGRMAGTKLRPSNDIFQLSQLKDKIIKSSGQPLVSPKDSPFFELLATCKEGSIGDFARVFENYLEIIPEITELTTIVHHTERIAEGRDDDAKGYATMLSYLLCFRRYPESLPALESFSKRYPDESTISILGKLPKEYEQGWENNPIYHAAIKNKPNEEDFPRDSDWVSDWSYGALNIFILLCRSGFPTSDAETVFTRIHRSKSSVRTVSEILKYTQDGKDTLSLISILTHRPKSFQNLLRIVAPITRDISCDPVSGNYFHETLSRYLNFTVWHSLSDEALTQIAGTWEGSYGDLITRKCHECHIPLERYTKTIDGFAKALQMYPDIWKNLDKFAKFEKQLFNLEADCMLVRVREYYIRKLKLPKEFPLSAFEDEKILTLLHILATNRTNTKLGTNLLLRVAKYHEAGKENPRFRSQKNNDWLLSHLPPAQKKIWLARNEKIYEVTEKDRKTDKSTEREIEKFVSVAKKLLENIEYTGSLDFSSYETFCEGLPEFLEKNPEFDSKFAKDLRFQKDSIERILHRAKSRSIQSVKIYHETDPLRVIMMGDWVDGSCLSSQSSIRNSWSTITNACEVNKAVFYAEDEKGNVIGRVLMAIDEERCLVPFTVYTRGNPDVDLSKMFEKYLREFSRAVWLPFWGNPEKVAAILGCRWYQDPVWIFWKEEE